MTEQATDQPKPAEEEVRLEQPENKTSWQPAIIAFIVLLVLAGATGYFWWKSGQIPVSRTAGTQTAPPAAPPVTPATTTPSEILAPAATSTATSTPPLPSGTSTQAEPEYRKGDTMRLFQGDEVLLWSQGVPRYRLQAVGFTDSRCPEGVQCIWAGERGVDLQAMPEGTKAQPQNLILRERTAASAALGDLKLILVATDDEKGGTYADIRIE